MNDLGKRAVACKHWRWMPGMRLRSVRPYLRIVGRNTDGSFRLSWDDPDRPVEGDIYVVEDLARATVDLTDPATLGCLMHLVREAWGGKVVIRWGNGWWEVETHSFYIDHEATDSFQAALVAALEAAE